MNKRILFCVVFYTASILGVNGQVITKLSKKIPDSIQQEQIDTSVGYLLTSLEKVTINIHKTNNRIRRGYDVKKQVDELALIQNGVYIIDSLLNMGTTIAEINLRNVISFNVLLLQFNKKLETWKADMDSYTFFVLNNINSIEKEVNKPTIQRILTDSILYKTYKESFDELETRKKKMIENKNTSFTNLVSFQKDLSEIHKKTNDLLEEVQYRIVEYSKTVFTKTHPPIWNSTKSDFRTSLGSDIKTSFHRSWVILIFYLSNNLLNMALSCMLGLAFFIWIKLGTRSLIKKKMNKLLVPLKYVTNFPILSSIILASLISPPLFVSSPAIFVETMFLIAGVTALYILLQKETAFVKLNTIAIFLLYPFFGLDNLLYSYSLGERWFLLLGNVLAVTFGLIFIRWITLDKKPYTIIFRISIIIFTISNILAFLFNCSGHFALSKIFSNSSVVQLVLALCLNLLTEIFTEAIFIQLETSKNSHMAAYAEYDHIKKNFKSVLQVTAIVLWVIGYIWSLSFVNFILQTFTDSLSTEIHFGKFAFSPLSIIIFILTLWGSVLLSNVLGIIFGSSDQQFASTKKSKVGNWMMLIRLSVIIIGFLLAIAAAGIPIDKLAIVFGALSVGIGFGLQSVVGNWVSGIILAFEKPMQIGDVIEIGNQIGTVKQIGIRSSKITTYDGAEIIVPNSDFISQKITNWTHSNSFRRLELLIGVAYGSSIEKVTELIMEAVLAQDNVMSFPKPLVLVNQFADNSLNFRVLFWTSDFDSWIALKSNALSAIYKSFAENSIQIPFPQQDVYIKSFPDIQKNENISSSK